MINRREAALCMAGLLAGCGMSDQPLSLAYHPWPGYASLHLVRSLELMQPRQLQLVRTSSASASLAAVHEGKVHGAALTLDEVLRARAQGIPLQILALLDVSSGADVVFSRQRLQRLGDLKGLRIGHEADAVGELMLSSLLQAAGLRHADVVEVHLPLEQQESAWTNGQIDVLITFEPMAGRLDRKGAIRIFDSQQLPVNTVIADVLAVHASAILKQEDHLQALLPALFRAGRLLNTQNLDSQYRLAPWLGLPPEQVMQAFNGLRLIGWQENRDQLVGVKPPLAQTAARLAAMMHEHGLLSARVSLDGLVNGSFLPLENPA